MLVCASTAEILGTVAPEKHVTDLVPAPTFELFEHSGHGPHYEEPERFNRVVGQFVDSV